MAGARRKARITALKVLYEVDCTQHKPENILASLIAKKVSPPETIDFSSQLVHGVLQNKLELDEIIKSLAPAFPLEQMPIIDRNILRLAIFEVLFDNNTPIKVAINEAVELAKIFGSASSPRLINGVLGSIVSKYVTKISKPN